MGVLDGDGHTLSGNQATHLLVARMTDLTVQKGQKVVVGKLTSDQNKDAIFLVVAADVL